MWSPTHVQVTVQRAKNLLIKGKNDTNNCFVTIALGKEKYQTSVKDKSSKDVEWHEECELTIPDQGNRAELILTCLHRNNIGIDEFLGQISLKLNEMDIYERPKSKWYKLESKPGKEKKKERGEIEIRIQFIVKSGSLNDLNKKDKLHHKSSIGQIASSVGGSLLSLGTIEKRKGIKKFAKSLSTKMHLNVSSVGNKEPKESKNKKNIGVDNFSKSLSSISVPNNLTNYRYGQTKDDADPGVISEDEDEFAFENLSHKSSETSLNFHNSNRSVNQQQQQHNQILSSSYQSSSPVITKKDDTSFSFGLRTRTLPTNASKQSTNPDHTELDEWEKKLYGKNLDIGSTDSLKRRSWETSPRIGGGGSSIGSSSVTGVPLNPTKEENSGEFDTSGTNDDEHDEENNKLNVEHSLSSKDYYDNNRKHLQVPNTAPTSPVLKSSKEIKRQNIKRPELIKYNNSNKSAFGGNHAISPLSRSNTTGNLLESLNKESENKDGKIEKGQIEKKRFGKLRYFRKEKHENQNDSSPLHYTSSSSSSSSPNQVNERIIVGHENHILKMGEKFEIPKEILQKYDGKSKEEIILIANSLENEVHIQRQRVKELEEYLDNLLLRVMETHPKILQKPYDRLTSTKSG